MAEQGGSVSEDGWVGGMASRVSFSAAKDLTVDMEESESSATHCASASFFCVALLSLRTY